MKAQATETQNALTFDIEADELEVFLQDVNEHLQVIEDGILRLERTADLETWQAVFRAAHTLKALAGAVGHYTMAELTHTLETLFDTMRESGAALTQEMADGLLTTLDELRALRDEVATQQPSEVDIRASLNRLQELLETHPGDGKAVHQEAPSPSERVIRPLSPEQARQAQAYQREGYNLLEIEVVADMNAFAPAARLVQAAMALMEMGEIIAQYPSMAALSNEQHKGQLRAVLATLADPGEIEAVLGDISDLASYRVQPHVLDLPPEAGNGPAPPALEIDHRLDNTVRISVERLDALMNLVGELVTDRTRLAQIEGTLRTQYGKVDSINMLGEMTAHFGRVVDQLQEEVLRARMLPIAHLFNKFPRLVRDVARAAGKQVDLVIEGETTELDRSIIEAIGDPLIHLLRNAVDHGIETPEEREAAGKPPTGTIRLTAAPAEGQIVITVEDDGRGIDPQRVRQAAVNRGLMTEEEAQQLDDEEAIDLIFLPTLSTAEKVTEVSGRGIGMDVVRANIERLSGSVVVESRVGEGTVFRLTLPLTLAIVQTMLVAVGQAVFAIPLASIIESLYLSGVTVSTVKGRPTIRWRDCVLPLLDMREFFAHPRLADKALAGSRPAVITVAWGKLRAGLVADRIIGKQEVVVKSFSPLIGKVVGLSGCAILGDGRIALVVDVPGLINAALQARKVREAA